MTEIASEKLVIKIRTYRLFNKKHVKLGINFMSNTEIEGTVGGARELKWGLQAT